MENITRTEIISTVKAGMLQINAPRFECDVIEVGVAGGNKARITISGTAENITALFDYVNDVAE